MELAEISWEGDSREVVCSFSKEARQDIGAALWKLQSGERPDHVRPMTSIGSGVFEIKTQDDRAWYRVIYLSKVGNTIYVLHAFEKDSRKTERTDLDTAHRRLVAVRKRLQEDKRDAKRKSR